MDLFIHGVYDSLTLKTLRDLGVSRVGFDLRGSSLNLVPFHILQSLTPALGPMEASIIFQDDKESTIRAFLDLLGPQRRNFSLEFRDKREVHFYESFHHPFYWMFDPHTNWKEILALKDAKGVILPLKWKEHYQDLPAFWHLVEEKQLEVHLHLESFAELEAITPERNLCLSLDLGRDVEKSFRSVDQDRLLKLRKWRKGNEATIGQR
jgi:hypothetical protein